MTDPLLLPSNPPFSLPSSLFPSFRTGQLDTIFRLSSSDHRFNLLSAPTGSGKSLIYMSLSRLTAGRTLVLVGTKELQNQLIRDFSSIGAVDVRGRSNYVCSHYRSCDEPYQLDETCPDTKSRACPYVEAVDVARRSPIVVTNFAYWVSLERFSDGRVLGDFDLLVVDEAHTSPDWITRLSTIEIRSLDIRSLLRGVKVPSSDDPADWKEWALETVVVAREAEERVADRHSRKRSRLTAIVNDLTDLARIDLGEEGKPKWVVEHSRYGSDIIPVWASDHAERYLFRQIPNVVLSSAYVPPDIIKYLNIREDESSFIESGSGFDHRRRPFYHLRQRPLIRVDHRMTEGQFRIWINRIDSIIEGRLDRKGLIHARSYDRMRRIVEASKYRDIMLTHDSKNVKEVVSRFKRAESPCILVSPSVEEGIDLPFDECRYIIIAKVPFIYAGTPLMKERSKQDRKYLNYEAAKSLIQMPGRGMRDKDDACETFLLDDHFSWFKKKVKFPRWFKDSWVTVDRIPDAMDI